MSQHSPGPWTVKPLTDGAGFRFIDIVDADGKRIFFVGATTYVGKETKDGWTRDRYDEVPSAQANANLAAAAPKLLAALQALLTHANIADAAPEDTDEEDRALERAARAAIAEATSADIAAEKVAAE